MFYGNYYKIIPQLKGGLTCGPFAQKRSLIRMNVLEMILKTIDRYEGSLTSIPIIFMWLLSQMSHYMNS